VAPDSPAPGSVPVAFAATFEVIPEVEEHDFPFEYRHMPFGNYRIVYRVDDSRVLVVRVIYAAQLLTPGMLQE